MITKFLMVTGKTEQILQPHAGCGQQIRLHGDSVTVTTGHLNDRFHTFRHGNKTSSNGRHPNNGCLAVSNINCINITLEDSGLGSDHLRITVLRRSQLTGYGKCAAFEHPLQIAPRFHRSSLPDPELPVSINYIINA